VAVKFSYGLEFLFGKGGTDQLCKLEAPKGADKFPLPKLGEEVSFVWEGEERHTKVDQWRFEYKVDRKGKVTGLHIVIKLRRIFLESSIPPL